MGEDRTDYDNADPDRGNKNHLKEPKMFLQLCKHQQSRMIQINPDKIAQLKAVRALLWLLFGVFRNLE